MDQRDPSQRQDPEDQEAEDENRPPITTPSGRTIDGPPRGKYWRISKEKLEKLDAGNSQRLLNERKLPFALYRVERS